MPFFVAFYSYKGGVGRTLALANVAYSLAAHGKRVVLVDMDLEAPGLHEIPELTLKGRSPRKGFLDYSMAYRETGECPDIAPYVHRCPKLPGTGQLWLMPAGSLGPRYQDQLGEIPWRALHPQLGTEPFVDGLRKALAENRKIAPHYVLIDARTGLSDIGGLSTHLLADMVVLVFNLTRSSIEGSVRAYRSFTAKGTRVRFVQLVASPVPPLPPSGGSSLIGERLAQAEDLMPLGTSFGRTLIRIEYHPGMVLAEDLAVRHPQDFPAAAHYETLRKALQRASPEEVFPVEEQARELRRTGQLAEAIAHLRRFAADHPDDPDGHLALGNFLFEVGRAAEAAEAFRQACKLAPDLAITHRRLGEALVATDQGWAAVEPLERAGRLGDQSSKRFVALANAYTLIGDKARAEEVRGTAIRTLLNEMDPAVPPATSLQALRQEFLDSLGRRPPYAGFQPEDLWEAVMESSSISPHEKSSLLQGILSGSVRPQEIADLVRILREQKEGRRRVWRALAWNGQGRENQILSNLKTRLERNSVEVVITGDIQELYWQFRSEGPWDLLLLEVIDESDPEVPDRQAGLSLAARIRTLDRDIPIVFLTLNERDVVREGPAFEGPTLCSKSDTPDNLAIDVLEFMRQESFSKARVFLIGGHGRKAEGLREKVKARLTRHGLECVESGQEAVLSSRTESLVAEMADCGAFVAICTPDEMVSRDLYQPRQNVLLEIGIAAGLRRGFERLVILQRWGEAPELRAQLPSDLGGILTIRFFEKYEEALEKLVEALKRRGMWVLSE